MDVSEILSLLYNKRVYCHDFDNAPCKNLSSKSLELIYKRYG